MLSSDRAVELRAAMVARLREQPGLTPAIEAALRAVPRHLFLPAADLDRVYSGDLIVTRTDERQRPISSSSQVSIMVLMLEQLALSPGLRVLEIGAGTGYNAALLDELVGEEGSVTTVEIAPVIAAEARERLAAAGHARVRVECGDGWIGIADGAPYDRIELTASTADLSPAWVEQLAEGGLLVAPLLLRPNAQGVFALRKRGKVLESVDSVLGGFMPLRGDGEPRDLSVQVGEWRLTASGPVDTDLFARLAARSPRVELAPELHWSKAWLLAIVADDSIGIARADLPTSTGVMTADGLAVIQFTHGSMTGPQAALLLSYGSTSALERLRGLIALAGERSFADLRVTAAPATAENNGRHYTFSVTLP